METKKILIRVNNEAIQQKIHRDYGVLTPMYMTFNPETKTWASSLQWEMHHPEYEVNYDYKVVEKTFIDWAKAPEKYLAGDSLFQNVAKLIIRAEKNKTHYNFVRKFLANHGVSYARELYSANLIKLKFHLLLLFKNENNHA